MWIGKKRTSSSPNTSASMASILFDRSRICHMQSASRALTQCFDNITPWLTMNIAWAGLCSISACARPAAEINRRAFGSSSQLLSALCQTSLDSTRFAPSLCSITSQTSAHCHCVHAEPAHSANTAAPGLSIGPAVTRGDISIHSWLAGAVHEFAAICRRKQSRD